MSSARLRNGGASNVTVLSLLAVLLVLLPRVASMVPAICTMGGCTCAKHVEDDSVSTLTCRDMAFTVIPNLRQFPNLTQLDLTGNNIGVIRASDFNPFRRRLVLLALEENQLHTIEEGAFRDMPKLQHLLLAHNQLMEIPADVFRGKTSFPTLDLSHNNLTAIPEGFTSVRSYIRVELSNNPIGNLKADALSGNLSDIEILDLSNIGMTALDTGAAGFWRFSLKRLFLDGNNFPQVNQNMLLGLSFTLKELSMRYCGIQVIKRAAFSPASFLETLLLDGNNLTLLRRGPFERLELDTLDLANCNISDIRMTAFDDLSTLKLYLQNNNISVINNREFQGLRKVEYLDLTNCSIREIRGTPFASLTNLDTLLLTNNYLTDDSYRKALKQHHSLQTLTLSGNLLTKFPNMPVDRFPMLHTMIITHNHIRSISRAELGNMTSLNHVLIGYNPLEGFPENDDTFADCGRMTVLEMDHTLLTRLPNLTYLPRLVELTVNHARLNHLPEDICCSCSQLGILEAQNNHLTSLPTLACKRMNYLDFSHNRLENLHGDLLKGMKHINTLDIRENHIRDLGYNFFAYSIDMEFLQIGGNELTYLPFLGGMPHLIRLNASHNRIRRLDNKTFSEQVLMDVLYLNNNDISFIDPTAFPVQSDLKILNLSHNGKLREWVVPTGGFPLLAELYLEEMFNLHQVPHAKDLPVIKELYLTYAYHCCIYEQFPGLYRPNVTELIDEEGSGSLIVVLPTAPDVTEHPNKVEGDCGPLPEDLKRIQEYFPDLIAVVDPVTCTWTLVSNSSFNLDPDMFSEPGMMEQVIGFMSSRTGFDIQFTYRDTVECVPHENPLTPCQFLLDPWVLKVAIWAVWVLALLGNGTVLFIGIATREKLESYELLICNLAFADFCMGIYLAFLAIVDVRTFGSSFFQSALDWQLGPGCKAAGFIAIFSSELSIYTLVMLTLERVYTLSHALNNQNETKRRRVVILLCVLGWVVAAGLAVLPIFGINSYDRVAVCLPYLTDRAVDKAYIGSILSVNVVSFLVIIASYIYIFNIVCRSAPPTNAPQRRKDMLVAATKIAVVIVTAFLCWTPIAVIGYLALVDIHLVDAREAKYFIVFVYPLNACVDPFIYAIFTKRFRSKFGSIFNRSKGRVTSFPPNHQMRLQRIQSAFSSEYQMSKISVTPNSRQEELTRLRQSRRSSSLVVQMVDKNPNTPSPTFNPPSGCNLGRRASLPPGFGSTLNMAGLQDQSNPNLPHYSIVPFRLGSVYSSDNSSLPNLQEESAMDLEADAVFSSGGYGEEQNPLTSSQESNLRRLSVVKEEEEVAIPGNVEGNAEGEEPEEEGDVFDDDGFSESSSEEYSDASDSIVMGGVGGTDLDHVMQHVDVVVHEDSRVPPAHPAASTPAPPTPTTSSEGGNEGLRKEKSCSPAPRVLDNVCRSKAYSCEDLHTLDVESSDVSPFVSSPAVNVLSLLSGRGWSLEQLSSRRSPDTKTGCVSNLYFDKSDGEKSEVGEYTHRRSQTPPEEDHTHNGRGYGRNGLVIGSEGDTCPNQDLNSQTLIKSLHYNSSAQPAPINITHSNPLSPAPNHAPHCITQQGSSDTSQASQSNYSKSLNFRETDL